MYWGSPRNSIPVEERLEQTKKTVASLVNAGITEIFLAANSGENWAVAGNAGVTDKLSFVLRITVPHGAFHSPSLPQRVDILDENFLVIKSGTDISCSSELAGFHLYGTDLCLSARTKGYTCYVIDFHLTHFGAGKLDENFEWCLSKIQRRWNPVFLCCYIQTTCALFFLSKYSVLRCIFGSQRSIKWVQSHPRRYPVIVKILKIMGINWPSLATIRTR